MTHIHVRRARKAISVDLLVALTDYQATALARARDHWLTVEDVIVHKLIAGRPRDIDDVNSILSTGIAFDEGYVSEWAAAWELDDLWDTLRNSEP